MFTRRGVIQATLAISALSSPAEKAFAQPAVDQRVALERFVNIPGKLDALKRGVSVMKQRMPSDPKSWFFQGAIHAVSPEAVRQAEILDPNVANVDQNSFWNQCPHGGPSSAEFLIWHRAYLHYFERILREASGDPTLSLPYWNYTDPTQRTFPLSFGDPDSHPATGLPRNPLFDHRREAAFMFRLYELSARAVDISPAFSEAVFFGPDESSGFAGAVSDSEPRTRGRIERVPHDMLHFAIGGSIGFGDVINGDSTDGLMASVQTAAFDPIFWVHHTNIDRLWTVWECERNRVWGNRPPTNWFDETPWSFNDVDGSIKRNSRIFYIQRNNLGLTYDTDKPDCRPLSSTDPRVSRPLVALGSTGVASAEKSQQFLFVNRDALGEKITPLRIGPDSPVNENVNISYLSPNNNTLKAAILSSANQNPVRIILELHGVELEGVTSVGFDVFVSSGVAYEPTRASNQYVGTISLFGARRPDFHASGHGIGNDHGANHNGLNHNADASSTERFDITRAILESENMDKVEVKIVPFDLLVSKNGERLKRPFGLKIGKIRVVQMEGLRR